MGDSEDELKEWYKRNQPAVKYAVSLRLHNSNPEAKQMLDCVDGKCTGTWQKFAKMFGES